MPTSEHKQRAAWLAVLGEPTRLAIITHLAAGTKSVMELAKACQTEMANASHHLKMMKAVGLVRTTKDGRYVYYSLTGATTAEGVLEVTHASGMTLKIPLN